MMHVVLYQPEIPPNTGNIARQCVGMNAHLHIVGPINMDLGTNAVRRAGLDYWDQLALTVHDNPDIFLKWLEDRKPWLITKSGSLRYDKAEYKDGDVLIFGNEINGLPAQWLSRWTDHTVKVPMPGNIRSYNLANTASIILAHALLTAGLYDT